MFGRFFLLKVIKNFAVRKIKKQRAKFFSPVVSFSYN